jgi:hypothetical protein
MSDYRALYEQATGPELPKDFDVHHINFDRDDNSIHNLLAIPKKLHIEYHKFHYEVKNLEIPLFPSRQPMQFAYFDATIKKWNKIMYEMQTYMVMRDFLIGDLPSSVLTPFQEKIYWK